MVLEAAWALVSPWLQVTVLTIHIGMVPQHNPLTPPRSQIEDWIPGFHGAFGSNMGHWTLTQNPGVTGP